jgi:acyl-CoA reductase-like NAD-dependent aldehyde dehydrogenase
MTSDFRMWIGGEERTGSRAMEVINPATEEVIAACPHATEEDLDGAVRAAARAFPAWNALGIDRRREALARIADAMDASCLPLARLLTQEQGKPIGEAKGEVARAAAYFRHFSDAAFETSSQDLSAGRRVEIHHRPLGVVGAIVPWNYPLLLMAFKLPAALLTGNTIVLKPAATTPLTSLAFGRLVADIVPPGVINVISDRNDLGAAITRHPGIRKISFTGSTETGRRVMAGASPTLKRLTLELGGNDAAIVLGDVDPAEVAPKLFNAAFRNNGQVCIAIKRLYVMAPRYDDVTAELARIASGKSVGNGLESGVELGPVQNRAQYERVNGLIEEAGRQATILSSDGPPFARGFFVRPTIVRDIEDGTPLVDEEQFGPVLPVIKVASEEEALARANASDFGLGGSIWSGDLDRAIALARRLEVGTAWINKHADLTPDLTFGGIKQSGFGRELGVEGLTEYTQSQVVNAALSA